MLVILIVLVLVIGPGTVDHEHDYDQVHEDRFAVADMAESFTWQISH